MDHSCKQMTNCFLTKIYLNYYCLPFFDLQLLIDDYPFSNFKLFIKLSSKKKGTLVPPPTTFQIGEGNCHPCLRSYTPEMVVVKQEPQTPMQHLSLPQVFLVGFILLNLQFSVLCQQQIISFYICIFISCTVMEVIY